MNGNTKFRVWATNDVNPEGRLYYPGDVIEIGVGGCKYEQAFMLSCHGDLYSVNAHLLNDANTVRVRWSMSGVVIEFCTGLKDKNCEQEVYCGDTFKIGNRIFAVQWDDYKCSYHLHDKADNSGDYWSIRWVCDRTANRIGTIHD